MTTFDKAIHAAADRAFPNRGNHPALAGAQRRAFESGARWARARLAGTHADGAEETPPQGGLRVIRGGRDGAA